MKRKYSRLVLAFGCVSLLASSALASDIRQESSVLAELRLDATTNQASAILRGATTSAGCSGQLLTLEVSSVSSEVLYSLLLSAHLGERTVAIWFDLEAGCNITQAHLAD